MITFREINPRDKQYTNPLLCGGNYPCMLHNSSQIPTMTILQSPRTLQARHVQLYICIPTDYHMTARSLLLCTHTCAMSSLYMPLLMRTHEPCFRPVVSFTTLSTSVISLMGTISCCHLPMRRLPMSSMACFTCCCLKAST